MSRRPIRLSALLVALPIAALLLMTGCAAPETAPAPTRSSRPSAEPTAAASRSPRPTPAPSTTFSPSRFTCNSLLPPASYEVFKEKEKDGFTLQPDYVQRLTNLGSDLVLFNTYGGVICQWAYPGSTKAVQYGFSAITAADEASVRAKLTSDGYFAMNTGRGVLLRNRDKTDFPDNYLFDGTYWFYTSDSALLPLIVDRVKRVAAGVR